MIFGKIISYLTSLRAKTADTDTILETLDVAGTTRVAVKGNGQTTINKNTTGDVLDVQNDGVSKFKVSNASVNTSLPINGKAIAVQSTTSDQVSAAPWYGIGYSNIPVGGGFYTQVAGYHGLRLRSSSSILDVNPTYINSNVIIKQGAAAIQDGFANVDPQQGLTAVFRNANSTDSSTEAYVAIGQGYTAVNAASGKYVTITSNNINGICVYQDKIEVYQPTSIDKATSGTILDVKYNGTSKLKVSDTAITASAPVTALLSSMGNSNAANTSRFGYLVGVSVPQGSGFCQRSDGYCYVLGTDVINLYLSNVAKAYLGLDSSSTYAKHPTKFEVQINDVEKLSASSTAITASVPLTPSSDNTLTLGNSSLRWSAVWAVNGTIQTSDLTKKKDVVKSPLGLDFILALDPIAYKFIVGGNKVEKVSKGFVKTLARTEEDGTEVYEDQEQFEEIVTPIEGKRQHFGFGAQQVKKLADEAGVDFGGHIQFENEKGETEHGLRYDEFIAPMVKAMQEQQAMIESLTKRLEILENK